MFRIRIRYTAVLFILFHRVAVITASDITVQAVRLTEPVVIDGILSETVWQTAPAVTGFLQRDPDEGAPASQETFVRIAYDDHALYVGAEMRDSAPDSIVARVGRRDYIRDEDFFALALDTYHDHRSGFFFGLSAGGTFFDGVCYNDDWTDDTWDGVWEGRVHHNERGWTAEMRIPYSQLRFKKEDRYVWGINFLRQISRRNEEAFLVYTPKNSSGFVSRFPHLTGIEGIRPGRHVEVLPYVRTRAAYTRPDRNDPFRKRAEYDPDAGVDMKTGLSHNLTLDLTVNPDFGQVEVDPAVVNLGDVETYFSEKRPFFIEGASIFNFGRGGANSYWNFNWSNPNFFYSRRIGRAPQGSLPDHDYADMPEGVHILGAAKVTGKLPGNWNVGTIHALTRREFGRYSSDGNTFRSEVEPLGYYGITRAQKEINDSRQGIGMLSTITDRRFDDGRLKRDMNDNALMFGLDGWTFLDTNRTWVLAGWTAVTRVEGTPERMIDLQRSSRHYYQRPDADHVSVDSSATSLSGYAGRFVFNKQKGNVIFNSALGFISPGFDLNDAGFLNRADVINAHVGSGYRWTQPGRLFRNCTLIGALFQTLDFGMNNVMRGAWMMGGFGFHNYMYLEATFDVIPETVNIHRTRGGPRTLTPPGWEGSLYFQSDNRKSFTFHASTYQYRNTSGDWYRRFGANLAWKPRSNMTVTAGPSLMRNDQFVQWVGAFDDPVATRTYGKRYVFAEMRQTEISTNIRLDWTFTPRLSLQFYIQPLISYGEYENYKELERPNSRAFVLYPDSRIVRSNGVFEIDPDGSGPARSMTFGNPDFSIKSLRGNAVLRWEYKPGSTLYLVWTQSRWHDRYEEPFSFRRSADRLWNVRSDNLFMLKATYWWSL
ncbi:MAG TPA: hypothetical protein ENN17_12375 [bacterium]|nr:hypothetical protein [bacterium]